MNEITTVGVDLAKEVIVVCAADAAGRAADRPLHAAVGPLLAGASRMVRRLDDSCHSDAVTTWESPVSPGCDFSSAP